MDSTTNPAKKNLAESIRARLKNLANEKKRPFDEILRYYAMERFLYRLSISPYAERFFLKGGLMLKVWNSMDHRATMDIDLLGKISNQIKTLNLIIYEVSSIPHEEDAIIFDTQKLILRSTQTTGSYSGISASFSAKLFTTKIPILIDIGFNDIIIPNPQKIQYPTLLEMPEPQLLGYNLETVLAEKLEAISKLALANTRIKDFYDIWTILKNYNIKPNKLESSVKAVFKNRKTSLKHPIAFTSAFYEDTEIIRQWQNFLSTLDKEHFDLKDVIQKIAEQTEFLYSET